MRNKKSNNTIARKNGPSLTGLIHFVHKDGFIVLFLIILFIPSILGLLHSGFPSTDDGGWMIVRFSAFYEAIRHGQFPVRFLMRLNNGYGYPVADFLYPLFMYLGVPLHVIGFSFINTIKIILAGSLVFSGIFYYLWLRKLFGQLASFVGAASYTLFPYHLFDVYQRGSVGEVLVLGIVPFVFWQIERRSFVLVALGISLLILSHNTLALLFLPIIIGYILLRKVFSILYLVFCIFLSLGLSAFFWIPALYDKQFTVFDTINVSDFSQYFLEIKNFNMFGILGLLVTLIGISLLFKKPEKSMIFFLCVIGIGLFFSLPVSTFLWHILPLPSLVQFPFRFLSIVAVGIGFVTALVLSDLKDSFKIPVSVLSLLLIYAISWVYLFPKAYLDYPDSYYATNQDSTTVKNEYMPKWVVKIPSNAAEEKVQIVRGQGSVSNLVSNGANTLLFTLSLTKASTIVINTVYFPGWQIFINNTRQKIVYNSSGAMEFSLSPGNYSVEAKFGETPIRLLADTVSLVSICAILILALKSIRKISNS